MDRVRAMEIFIQIVDRGSMSRAATVLGVSSTTVSTYLASLEAHLGRRLLDRSTRRINLTEDGRRFLEDARHIVDAVAMAEDMTRGSDAVLRGRVRIDVPASIGHRYVLPALPGFLARHPAIELDVILGDRASVFRPDGFDVLIRVGETAMRNADVRCLGQSRFVHVAAPSYLARRGIPETPGDIEDHDCILYSTLDQPGGRWWSFQRDGKVERIRPRSQLSLNDGNAIAAAAMAGLGIARTLEMLVSQEIADRRLSAVLNDWADESVPIYAVAAADRSRIPVVSATLAFLETMRWTS